MAYFCSRKYFEMIKEQREFYWTTEPNPHHVRVRKILKEHPEVKELIGKNPMSLAIIIGLVTFQVAAAFFLKDASWWLILVIAYTLGAFASHALWVMIHECGHNLLFKGKTANFLSGILANTPHIIPSAVSFQHYHNRHHTHQGVHDYDADLPDFWEARLFSKSALTKAFWMMLFPFFQVFHTIRLKDNKKLDGWLIVNWIVQIAFNVAVYIFLGPKAFFYLLFSFLFSVGFHPLGARWIQEHYLVLSKEQETYSYYGPLNKAAFNIGFHNEHHDFPSIPWNKLPQLKKQAPGYYDNLLYHKSWTKLFFRFIFDPKLSLYSRIARRERKKILQAEAIG